MKRKPKTAGLALASDLAELTLLACAIRLNASRMLRVADMLEANLARLKARNRSTV